MSSLIPPFDLEGAKQKVRMAENAWNGRDAERIALAYSVDSHWRNRSEIFQGRQNIVEFLKNKWTQELEYRLVKELWAFGERKIAVRFQYEYHTPAGDWFRAHGNENWEFDDEGLMRRREASINDRSIKESERRFFWPLGKRPDDHKGLIDSPE